MNHDRVTREGQETAALYALGALSQHETRAFDEHLQEGCAACYSELEEFERVIGLLGEGDNPATPPAYVRDILTLRIEKEAAEPARASGSVIPFPEKSDQRTNTQQTSSLGRILLPWAAAAALFIALAYTFSAWRSERQSLKASLDQEKERGSQALGDNKELKELLSKENAASNELSQINSVLKTGKWRLIQLTGQPPAPDSSAKVYWDIQAARWAVSADLPPAPAGKVYQLWFVTPSAKISAGLIRPDKSGHAFAVVQLPSNVGTVAATAITLEPEGGSDQPTMPIYALGKVS